MTRIVVSIGIALLLTQSALAQSYCDQVRQGVATYGYSSAKRYAIEHYGAKAARTAEKCLSGKGGTRFHRKRK